MVTEWFRNSKAWRGERGEVLEWGGRVRTGVQRVEGTHLALSLQLGP